MKRTMKVIPIALILVLLIATATLFAVLPVSGDEAYASGSVSLSLSTMQAQGTCPDSYIEYGDWWWEGVTGTNGGIKFTDNQITINYENAAILQSVNKIKVTGSLSSDITVGHAAVLYNNSNWPQSSGTGSTINIDRNFAKDPNADIFTLFFTKDDLTDSTTTVTITSLEITLYYSTTEPVAITKGTGVKSVYLSTTNTATSGSASGTEFESGATVYGFAELAKGYNAGSGWTRVSGTANTEGAKYCVGSVTAGSNNFGTISATKATYNITYNLNNGTHGSTHPNTYQVDTNTFTISNPTRTGYTFKGWSGTGLSGDSNKNVSVAKGSVGNRTYTANWTLDNYTISYTLNGGGDAGNPTSYTYVSAQINLIAPSKTGYTFSGWTGSNGSTPQTSVSIPTGSTGNKSYTANWTANHYTVNVNGQNVDAVYDATFPDVSTVPTKDGYTFFGYYDANNADGTASPSGTRYTDGSGHGIANWTTAANDVTLYPYFTKNMSVSATGYEADYDASAHGITVTVTDPVDGYTIEYGEVENVIIGTENPQYTNVGEYTVYYYVNKAGYTESKGSATVVINEVNKAALIAIINSSDNYLETIETGYPDIANTLDNAIDVANDIYINENVTATQVATAVSNLEAALSTAKVDVTKAKIDAIGSGVYSAERAAKIEDARNYYDTILSVAEKEIVDNYADLQAAEALYGPVGNVVNEINALRTITNPQEFNTAVQTARAQYEGLDSSRKAVFPADTLKVLTDSEAIIPVVTEINAIGASADTDAFRNAVSTARTNFDALTDDQEEIFPASVLKVLTDDEAAINVMDLINAIGDVAYNSTSKGKIDDANMAYDLLDNTQKALVANVGKLTQANTDYDKVDTFVNAVNAIGPVVYTEGCKDLIDAARDAYEDLSQYQKSIVPNESYVTLLNDEAAYDAMDIISAIAPIANDDATRQRLEDAQAAVYDLTPAQLALVTPSFLDYLANAVAVVDFMDEVNAIGAPQDTQAFRDAVEAARDTYDNGLNAAQKALVPASVLATLTDDEAIIPVMDEIGDIGTPANTAAFRDAVEDARDSYDGLTPEQKAIFPADTLGILTDDEAIIDVLDKIDAIGDYEYSDDCKDLIDEAREAYDGLTDSQKARFPQEDLSTLVDDEKAYDFMDKVEKIGAVENTPESLEKVIAARDAFNNMTDGQKALVDPDCIDTFADALAAATAIDKINAIGEVEYTPEDKALIEEARNYYNALPAEQKALVPEGTLAALVKAEQDYAAVQAEVEKIVAIENIRYDEDSKNIILAARQAYEALTEDQKAFFPEDTLNDLIGKEKAYETIEKIAAIGTVEYTEENKALIDEARAAYDALTPEQKALIHADDLQVLTISEETYATKDGKAKALYTALLVIVCLIICLCLLVLAYIIYRIMDSKKKNSKVLSIAFLPLLLGASHYIDSPFIALYVLSGIALVLLVANIILALKYPHFFKDIKEFFTKKDKDEQDNAEAKEEPAPIVAPVAEVAAAETNEEDEDEVLYVTDTSGNIFQIRFVKSFMAKLIQSSDETKAYYKELKNEILSYKGVKDRVSWHYDSHNYGRNQVIKFGVRGKTLCVYYALDIVDLKGSKYKVELCESSKYAAVPCMYRIRNDRRCAYAKDLIAMVAAKFGLVKGAQADVDYSFPYEDTQTLVNKGLVKELKTAMDNPAPAKKGAHHAVTVQEADAEMTDEVAITYIIDDVEGKEHNGKKGIINIDVLSNNFNDGDKVDIEALWEKKLIATNIGQVKLLAKGSIDKALDVDLQDYSLQAVKMIILAGGTVHKAK